MPCCALQPVGLLPGWRFCGVVFLAGVLILPEVAFGDNAWPLSFIWTSKELPPDFQPHPRMVNVS